MSDVFASGYQPEEGSHGLADGDYRVKIVNVTQKTAQSSGNPMLVIELKANEAKFTLKYNLVKNEYFNVNATQFFDSFGIPRGDFQYHAWLGKIGKAHVAKGKPNSEGKQYSEVKYFIVQQPQLGMGQQTRYQQRPAQQQQTRPQQPVDDHFSDDIPF